MQNSPPNPSFSVIAGFFLCGFLMVIIGLVAYYGLTEMESLRDDEAMTNELLDSVVQTKMQFADILLAAHEQDETHDEAFYARLDESFMKMEKKLNDASYHLVPENREQVAKLLQEIEQFAELHRVSSKIRQDQREIMQKTTAFKQPLIESVDELIGIGTNELMPREERDIEGTPYVPKRFVERQESLARLRSDITRNFTLHEQYSSLTNREERDAFREKIELSQRDVNVQIDELMKRFTTAKSAEMAKRILEIYRNFQDAQMSGMMLSEKQMHVDIAIDKIALSLQEQLEEIIAAMEKNVEMHYIGTEVFLRKIVLVVLTILIGVVVAMIVRPKPQIGDAASPVFEGDKPSSCDMGRVADKLQEIADMLRR